MLTKSDIGDVIFAGLSGKPRPAGEAGKGKSAQAGKIFISDWELRRMMSPGQKTIRVPSNAIISPLSVDWLEYDGIKIIKE